MEQGEARGSPEGAHGSVGKGDWMWLQQQVTPLWLFLSRGPFVLLTVTVPPSDTRRPLMSPELLSPPEAPLWRGGLDGLLGFPSQRQRHSALEVFIDWVVASSLGTLKGPGYCTSWLFLGNCGFGLRCSGEHERILGFTSSAACSSAGLWRSMKCYFIVPSWVSYVLMARPSCTHGHCLQMLLHSVSPCFRTWYPEA